MINFTKMHGLGNDYIYICQINNKNIIPEERIASTARYLSNRHFGVGADGIILIQKSNIADFKMRILNQDGTEAQMCGNGIRCFAKYVYENGLTKNKDISIETLCGIKYVTIEEKNNEVQNVIVNMGSPIFQKEKIPVLKGEGLPIQFKIEILDKTFDISCISVGNPHAIIVVDNVDKFDVKKYGAEIENNEAFPEKTNVEFVQILDKAHIKMRVWERGSGETMACGTGACASCVVCNLIGMTKRKVNVMLPGGELFIDWKEENNNIYMSGIATKVFDGKIDF